MTQTLETEVRRGTAPEGISSSEAAKVSSAHSRINIPLNLENWKHLPEPVQKELLWFHQHLLDEKMGNKEAGQAIDYDETTVWRVLKGSYEGNWKNIVESIQSYRKLWEARGQIQQSEFAENAATRLIFGALDYAMANNSIAIVVGESGQGKTVSRQAWCRENNHGRAVPVVAPPYGGVKALLVRIAEAVGVNKNNNTNQLVQAIYRAFNSHRMLIVDEAHRVIPGDRRANPVMLEVLRDIHDQTHCALGLLATERFSTELRKGEYMFEQVLGRSLVVRLPRKTKESDIEPIVRQYLPRPSRAVMEAGLEISNKLGRIRVLVEVLKVASRIAKKGGERMSEEHFLKAVRVREQMMGEVVFSKGS